MKKYKFSLLVALATLIISNNAVAALKVLPVPPAFTLNYVNNGDQVAAGLLIKNSLIISSTLDNPASGISSASVASYGLDGTKQWELSLNGESMAGPISKDTSGNIYVLGASNNPIQSPPSQTPTPAALNPDNVQADSVTTPTNTLNSISVWKISSDGKLIQTFTLPINEAVVPMSLSAGTNNFIIGANTANQYLQIPIDQNGNFGTISHPRAPKILDLAQDFIYGKDKIKFFISSKGLIGIPSWKPKKPTPVLIQYSKLGQKKAANYFQGKPLFVFFNTSVGAVVGTEQVSGFGIYLVKPIK